MVMTLLLEDKNKNRKRFKAALDQKYREMLLVYKCGCCVLWKLLKNTYVNYQ